jgi:hypothetical protein
VRAALLRQQREVAAVDGVDVMSERKVRHFALYRLRGMLRNLVEISMDVPLSDMEHEYVDFLRETIQALTDRWGTVRWTRARNHK